MNSWVKLFLKLQKWEWYRDVPTFKLWIHVLLKANFVPTSFRGIEIPRGSFNTTEDDLAYETGLSRQQVRTAIKKLISTNEITKKTTKGITIITINKYEDYQCTVDEYNQQNDVPSTKEITTSATTNQPLEQPQSQPSHYRVQKSRRVEDKKFKPPFIPPTVEEVREYCESRKNGIDPEMFIDFYSSKNWMVGKNKMSDWKASVRTWERSRHTEATPKEPTERKGYDKWW